MHRSDEARSSGRVDRQGRGGCVARDVAGPDPHALGELVRLGAAALRALGRAHSDPELEDALQSTYLLYLERRPSIANPPAWFAAVLRRKLCRALARRRRFLPFDEARGERSCAPSAPETRLVAEEILATLPPREAAALRYRHLAGCSVSEVAVRLGVTPANAKKILARTLARLRRRLLAGARIGGTFAAGGRRD